MIVAKGLYQFFCPSNLAYEPGICSFLCSLPYSLKIGLLSWSLSNQALVGCFPSLSKLVFQLLPQITLRSLYQFLHVFSYVHLICIIGSSVPVLGSLIVSLYQFLHVFSYLHYTISLTYRYVIFSHTHTNAYHCDQRLILNQSIPSATTI